MSEKTLGPVAESFAVRVCQDIVDGKWAPGQDMPSTRSWKALDGPSYLTVNAVYGWLAERNVLVVRPRAVAITSERCVENAQEVLASLAKETPPPCDQVAQMRRTAGQLRKMADDLDASADRLTAASTPEQ